MPDIERSDESLEGRCGTAVEEAFETVIKNQNFLLSEQGELLPWGACVSVPSPLFNIWDLGQITTNFVINASVLSQS
ncbi:MAG TPA: hypothetical protein VNO50_23385, partial [Pyrinomonadaceae bacterium]|nr:hypothetical protein [Pyrinomonadaceae bacterium]